MGDGAPTIQGLKRLSYLPERGSELNGDLLAGQDFFDVYFTGGYAENLTLSNVTITSPIFSSPLALASGGTGASLTAPAADRIFFYDFSAGQADFLIPGSGLTIVDKTITVSGVGLGDVTGPMSSTDEAISRFNGSTGKIIQSSTAFLDDSGNITTAGNITASGNLSGANFSGTFSGTSSGTNTGDQTNITGNAGTVTTINGRISNGTGTTVGGSGTSGSPYVINNNTTQNIAALSNLTSNGVVTTTSGNGTLVVAAATGSGDFIRATGPTITGATLTTSSVNGVTLSTAGNAGQSLNGAGAYANRLTLATSQSATGTFIDFTSIPSWVRRITVNPVGVSLNGSADILIQIGDSGGVETTGYAGSSSQLSTGAQAADNYSNGFGVKVSSAAAVMSGAITLNLVDATNNTWAASGNLGLSNTGATIQTGGAKSTSATLDRVRITTSNGSDTFDAGIINILYE